MFKSLISVVSISLLSSSLAMASESLELKVQLTSNSQYLLQDSKYVGQLEELKTSIEMNMLDQNNVAANITLPAEKTSQVSSEVLNLDGNKLTILNKLTGEEHTVEVVVNDRQLLISKEENLNIANQSLKARGEMLLQKISMKMNTAELDFKFDVSSTQCVFTEVKTKLDCTTSAIVVLKVVGQ